MSLIMIVIFFSCRDYENDSKIEIDNHIEPTYKECLGDTTLSNGIKLNHIAFVTDNGIIHSWEAEFNSHTTVLNLTHREAGCRLSYLCNTTNSVLLITGNSDSRSVHLVELYNDTIIYTEYYTGVSSDSRMGGAGFKLEHLDTTIYIHNLSDSEISGFSIEQKNSKKTIDYIYLVKDSIMVGFHDKTIFTIPKTNLINKEHLNCR